MSSADIITSTSDKIVLHTLNCGGTFSYPGTGNVEISFPVKSRPKIIGDIITRPYLADEILTCKYDPRNGCPDGPNKNLLNIRKVASERCGPDIHILRINGINLTPKWKSILAMPEGEVIDPDDPVTQIIGDVACKDSLK